jgi:hypothetical protein
MKTQLMVTAAAVMLSTSVFGGVLDGIPAQKMSSTELQDIAGKDYFLKVIYQDPQTGLAQPEVLLATVILGGIDIQDVYTLNNFTAAADCAHSIAVTIGGTTTTTAGAC